MLASYLLDATRSSHPLEDLALEHAGYKALSEEDVCGRGAKAMSFRDIPLETRARLRGRARRPGAAARSEPCRAARTGAAGAALPRSRDAAHPGARRRRAGGHPHRRAALCRAVGARRAGAGDAQRADLRDGRRGVQHQLAAAAVAHSLREAAAADAQAEHQDQDGVDRRRSARGAGARARHAAADPRVARRCRSSKAPTSTRCRSWSTPRPAASTPASTRRSRRPGG